MGWKKSARSKRSVVTLSLAVACAAAAALVIAAKTPTQPAPMAEMQPEAATAATTPAPNDVVAPAVTKTAAAKKAAVPAKTAAAKTSAKAPSVSALPTDAVMSDAPVATPRVVESEMKTPAQESPVRAAMPPAALVTTIAGCLERDGDGFRLKDTDGASAPKSRGWKSGFLKKGSAKIDLVDSANRLKFQDHVGRRVSVTGTLDDHELTARSLQRVATSCE